VLSAAQNTMASSQAKAGQGTTEDITRFDARAFGLQPDISIDYAVMERATNVTLVPAKFGWSDVGAWPAVAAAHTANSNGNTMACDDHIDWIDVDTTNTHIHIDSRCGIGGFSGAVPALQRPQAFLV
jgi:mannose-1-phosphate guanylyltransferase